MIYNSKSREILFLSRFKEQCYETRPIRDRKIRTALIHEYRVAVRMRAVKLKISQGSESERRRNRFDHKYVSVRYLNNSFNKYRTNPERCKYVEEEMEEKKCLPSRSQE